MTLDELRELARAEREKRDAFKQHIHVCTAVACLSQRSDEVKKNLETEIKKRGLDGDCRVTAVGCLGLCAAGPIVALEERDIIYQGVQPSDTAPHPAQIAESVQSGSVVRHLELAADLPFFTRQQRIVREQSGRIDPERIEDCIASGGYEGLLTALTYLKSSEVIEQIQKSGLRGRGGAGYPTGLKWSTVAKASGAKKYVICNGDEGDPGAFMDRSVMESDPQRVIEGMAIAAYAVGADQAYIYVRSEYPLAIKRLKIALRQAEQKGLLGHNICDTQFSLKIDIRLGGGAFVCGEETALLASIEGQRGTPRARPPYPAQRGLWGCPTLINNVETYANVPAIITKGASWYAAIGTEKSKGTKVFALTGKIRNTGLIEVPMGITLREVIFDIGGGVPEGRKFKAAQTGGPSGGCVPDQYLDMPLDYESLMSIGSIMGSGGLIVMDDSSCMVDVAKYFMDFCASESCGKCIPCRVGTVQMLRILQKICDGEATEADLVLLEQLCEMVQKTSLCGLGQTAPNPVVSTLRFFRDEYLAHIHDKRCPAGVCAISTPVAVEVSQ